MLERIYRALKVMTLIAAPSLMPPSWFLEPVSLEYSHETRMFTFQRNAASVANFWERCREPSGADDVAWCEDIDTRYQLVMADWKSEAFALTDPVQECTATGRAHYQWVAINRVTYSAGLLAECFGDHDTAVRLTRRVWLFGVYPLARVQRERHLFDPTPAVVEPLQRQIESLNSQVRSLQQQLRVTQ